jgi:GH15 family glucan-1,4-alpha-glucosidase
VATQTAEAPANVASRRRRYPPIESHGMIGDLQTAALVVDDGTIDWFCSPRFDSPSIFAALLDYEKGGHFQITAQGGDDIVVRQLYMPDSAVLITRFMTTEGVGEVVDFMPISDPDIVTNHHRIVRIVRSVRGDMRFRLECAPRFDYGRQTHVLQVDGQGATFRTPSVSLQLNATIPLRADGGDVWAEFVLHQGERAGVVLESSAEGPARGVDLEDLTKLQNLTLQQWSLWVGRSTYEGRWRDLVQRSAITLRMLIYAPTGAPVAALTTGLPEVPGGERNWDYRYTWLRDASFSIYALLGLGYRDEAIQFLDWTGKRVVEHAKGGTPLKIMYRVDGSSDLEESSLDHFEGWRGSRPVRIGNGAAGQRQLDIYGEVMDSIYHAHQASWRISHRGWRALSDVIYWLAQNWDTAEEGIWETRGGQREFTYGRLQTWVALDRMVRMARDLGRPADTPLLNRERDKVYAQIIEKGWNPTRGAFTQHYETDVLDASILLMPVLGFIAAEDDLWKSTLAAIDKELVSDSLVYRYNPSASPDGLRGHEGTFSICTFWYVDALSRSGRLDDARLVFEKMMSYANQLGLFAEEIGPTGEQLGNFPQAFSHLALINAALNLDYQLDHGAGQVDVLRAAVSRIRA